MKIKHIALLFFGIVLFILFQSRYLSVLDAGNFRPSYTVEESVRRGVFCSFYEPINKNDSLDIQVWTEKSYQVTSIVNSKIKIIEGRYFLLIENVKVDSVFIGQDSAKLVRRYITNNHAYEILESQKCPASIYLKLERDTLHLVPAR